MAFSPDGTLLATGGAGRTVQFWDVRDLAHPTEVGAPLSGLVNDIFKVAINMDGKLLAAADAAGSGWLWNIAAPAHPGLVGRLRAGDGGEYACG